jgi:hypothetical protein
MTLIINGDEYTASNPNGLKQVGTDTKGYIT